MEKKGLADTKAAAPAGLVLGFDELEAAGSQAAERG